MTFLSSIGIAPRHCGTMKTPQTLTLSDITVVMPVKNNPAGVERFLNACLQVFSPHQCPKEILLIDNMSCPPLEHPSMHTTWGLPIRVLVCSRPGAAAARNMGAYQARTPWVLFVDSDCLPTAGWIEGYRQALNGSVAYAGMVRAVSHDWLSRYYETQKILHPVPLWIDGEEQPNYVITANTLIWRDALAHIGGLDERFPSAAGEDIDLGIRLWEVGSLAYAPTALVYHHFEPHLGDFVRRFLRYGRGNRFLSARYQTDMSPHPFTPVQRTWLNRVLAHVQYCTMWWGYHMTWPHVSWASPSHLPSWPISRQDAPKNEEDLLSMDRERISPLSAPSDKVVVLIDGDCISPKWITAIAQEIAPLGSIAQGWVYHSRPTAHQSWERERDQLSWTLTVVAGDPDTLAAKQVHRLLRTTTIRRFCLVSNDKDWAQIARRIQETAGVVWGMGSANAARTLQQTCDVFRPFPATIQATQVMAMKGNQKRS